MAEFNKGQTQNRYRKGKTVTLGGNRPPGQQTNSPQKSFIAKAD